MKNLIINNLLTDSSIKLLNNLLETEIIRNDIWVAPGEYSAGGKDQYLSKINDTVGVKKLDFARIDLHNLKIPQQVLDEISEKLIINNLLNYKYCGQTTAMMYKKSLGNPKLTDHLDKTEHPETIMVDYQLISNTSWAINVEGVDYVLSDNQALIFCGNQQRHSRKFKKFNDGEFLTNVMFRYNPNPDVYLQ